MAQWDACMHVDVMYTNGAMQKNHVRVVGAAAWLEVPGSARKKRRLLLEASHQIMGQQRQRLHLQAHPRPHSAAATVHHHHHLQLRHLQQRALC